MTEKSNCAVFVRRSGSFSPKDWVASRREERRLVGENDAVAKAVVGDDTAGANGAAAGGDAAGAGADADAETQMMIDFEAEGSSTDAY